MTKTLSVNDISIEAVIKSAKNGEEIVLEENGKPIAENTIMVCADASFANYQVNLL